MLQAPTAGPDGVCHALRVTQRDMHIRAYEHMRTQCMLADGGNTPDIAIETR